MESYTGILLTIFVIIIAIIFIGDKKYGNTTRTQAPPTRNRAQSRDLPPPESGQRRSVPSVAPTATSTKRVMSIYQYPKCPICRSRNLRGEAQTVFCCRDGFRCVRGHTFTGR